MPLESATVALCRHDLRRWRWLALLGLGAVALLAWGVHAAGARASIARPIAFAAVWTHDAAHADERISFTPAAGADEASPAPEHFAQAPAGRRPLAWRGARGVGRREGR